MRGLECAKLGSVCLTIMEFDGWLVPKAVTQTLDHSALNFNRIQWKEISLE